MNSRMLNKLKDYEKINRKMDELYHREASMVGLSDCAGMILYALSMSDEPITQKEICEEISMPKQTVNSALKKLETDGIIKYRPRNDRRYKDILLTEKGESFAEETSGKLITTLCEAFSDLSDKEQDQFLRLYRKLAESFEARIG